MGLFFVSKSKYKLLEERAKRLVENRDYWKGEAQRAINEKAEVSQLVKDIAKARDFYKVQSENHLKNYRKVMSSNGGYKTDSNKMKKTIAEQEKKIEILEQQLKSERMSKQDGLRKTSIIIDESHHIPLKYKPKKKNERKKEN